ncbi:MAG TPA: hypothetical protein V6D22_17240 [Candidatus Obscuribacterales bacterium]
MKFDVRENKILAHGALISAISLTGILIAQGFNKLTKSQAAITQSTITQTAITPSALPSSARTQPSGHGKIVQWFTRYDAIRRQAQMTPEEKMTSGKLMTEMFTGAGSGDKAEGKALLSKMVSRYTVATKQLNSLPPTPQTVELQKGYVDYFTTGRAFFSKYLHALDSNQSDNAMDNLRVDRLRMASLDMSNKSLDKKLRAQFGISPYTYY